jgi:protein-tyrosine phosphatase
MIDVHSHILSGIDDGAETPEESVAMALMAAKNGTTDIVATPHANQQFRFDYDLVTEKIMALQEACGDRIKIHRGCDFHLYFENIEAAVAQPTRYTINNRCYLLVEFADFVVSRTVEPIFDRLQRAGMIPVITHPERNSTLIHKINDLARWVQRGCMLQVTANSFTGRWGKHTRQFSEELLRRGMIHVIASDAHDTEYRPPILSEAFEHIKRKHSPERAQLLCVENPRAMLTGDSIDYEATEDRVTGKKWFEFWK